MHEESAAEAMRAARTRIERAMAVFGRPSEGEELEPWRALREAANALRVGEQALAHPQGAEPDPPVPATEGNGDPPLGGSAAAVREIAELRVASESLDALLGQLSAYVVVAVESADGASVTLLTPGSLGATDAAVEESDRLQYMLREGPCHDAMRTGEVRWSGAAVTDPRWPRLGAAMQSNGGFRSILAVPLDTGERVEGVLNVYARHGDAFDETSRRIARVLAGPIAATLADARAYSEQADLVSGLQQAVDSHSQIGQAVGILMVREGLDADAAFARLRRISNDTNRKLRDVAAAIVSDATPEPPAP